MWQEGEKKEQFLNRLVWFGLFRFVQCIHSRYYRHCLTVALFYAGSLIGNLKQGHRPRMHSQLLSGAVPSKTLLWYSVMLHLCEIVKTHDGQSEGSHRRAMIEKKYSSKRSQTELRVTKQRKHGTAQ